MHPGSRIGAVYLCRDPIDFRKSIDGLSALVEQELALNLFGDSLFVFTNRARNKIKALLASQWVLSLVQAARAGALCVASAGHAGGHAQGQFEGARMAP
jgi:transposase